MTLPEGKYTPEEISWFRSVFDLYYNSIRNFAYYKTGNSELADDIVQEVFLKLWEMRSKIKNETLKALLYTITGNLIKNHYKHLKIIYRFENNNTEDFLSEEADSMMRQNEMQKQLQDVLAIIPEKARMVFLMNRMDDLSYVEIAERLNLSVKAIEKRMSEAIGIIRKHIHYKI